MIFRSVCHSWSVTAAVPARIERRGSARDRDDSHEAGRQLPVDAHVLVDPAGALLYYNEPAEKILGRRYDESGEMPLEEWATIFVPTDEAGKVIPLEALPLSRAVQQGCPTTVSSGSVDWTRPPAASRSLRSQWSVSTVATWGRWPSSGRPRSDEDRPVGRARVYPVSEAGDPRYGGNTSCVEVCSDDPTHVVVLDAGTGVCALAPHGIRPCRVSMSSSATST